MADRFRAEVKGDDVLLVIKGKVGPELAVTVAATDLLALVSTLNRARWAALWQAQERING